MEEIRPRTVSVSRCDRCHAGTPPSLSSPPSQLSCCSPRPPRRRTRSTGGSDRASRSRSSARTGQSFVAYSTAGTPSSSATARASTTSTSSGRASTEGRASLSPAAAGGASGCAPGPTGTGATLTGQRCEGDSRSSRSAPSRLRSARRRGGTAGTLSLASRASVEARTHAVRIYGIPGTPDPLNHAVRIWRTQRQLTRQRVSASLARSSPRRWAISA
jgi:hypothetical protein